MKLAVLIGAVVVAMSISGEGKASEDPWCNPSYCPPDPGYPGGGSTSREDTAPYSYPMTISVYVDCRQITSYQQRFELVKQAFLAENMVRKEYSWTLGEVGVVYMEAGSAGRYGFEHWLLDEPFAPNVLLAPVEGSYHCPV